MNKTPNYQLNQWEAEDRVLRTDFNADNAKIDAALGAIPAAVLYHKKLEADVPELVIDLSGRKPERLISMLMWVQLPRGDHRLKLQASGSGYSTHSNSVNSSMYANDCLLPLSASASGVAPVCVRMGVGRPAGGGPYLTAVADHFYRTSGAGEFYQYRGICYVYSLNSLSLKLTPETAGKVVPAGTEIAVMGFHI